jgi:hypothetical protein
VGPEMCIRDRPYTIYQKPLITIEM